jgi:hypothetical protein
VIVGGGLCPSDERRLAMMMTWFAFLIASSNNKFFSQVYLFTIYKFFFNLFLVKFDGAALQLKLWF